MVTEVLEKQQLSFGIMSRVTAAVDISYSISEMPPEFITPAANQKKRDGWDGNNFFFAGQKFIVAISPEISENGLHEIHTYRFDGDKPTGTIDKPCKIVTKPSKQPEPINYTTDKSVTAPTTDKKCLFCGKSITWGNAKTVYCTGACKTAAYRKRKELERTF